METGQWQLKECLFISRGTNTFHSSCNNRVQAWVCLQWSHLKSFSLQWMAKAYINAQGKYLNMCIFPPHTHRGWTKSMPRLSPLLVLGLSSDSKRLPTEKTGTPLYWRWSGKANWKHFRSGTNLHSTPCTSSKAGKQQSGVSVQWPKHSKRMTK